MDLGRFDAALAEFAAYETALPGNPNTPFYKGLCLEKMGWRRQAAYEYMRYRNAAPSGEFSGYAAGRLTDWGYIKPRR